MSESVWFENGLRFECSQCGNCCTGESGYVWVNKDEIVRLAATLGMDVAQFESRYVRRVGKRKSLVELANGDCVFFDNQSRKCMVYADRPRQCRTWPFWRSNVRTPQTWESTCQVCPGSGRGRLYQLQEIQKQLAVIDI